MRLLRFPIPVLLLLVATLPGCDRGAHPAQPGHSAPDFTVSDGISRVHLADYRGKVVLLNFWWTQCAPCIEEMPGLIRLHHDRPDIAMLAVSIDEDADAYANFLSRWRLDLITVRDPSQSAAKLYHSEGWPETYIIDRGGIIRRKFIGAQDWSDPEIRAYLKSL